MLTLFSQKKSILLLVLFSITACQNTPKINDDDLATNGHLAAPNAIAQALMLSPEPLISTPIVHDNIWQRIRSQLSLTVPDNKEVAKWRKYYLRHPNFMMTISERAEPFLYYIVEEIERRNMPIELALLPIVESAYLPYGVSNQSAAGLWQFMPVAAKRFKLTRNWWYDGRRDVVASTNAALDYFQFFHRTLGQDWLNAVAAFNSGEGRVGRAIAKNKRGNKPYDFWSLDLPRETTAYVPKLLAIIDILQRADEFNYVFTPIKNSPAVTAISLESQLDITLAAEWTNIEAKELVRLNPGLNRGVTPPDDRYKLLVPVASATKLQNKLASTKRTEWLRRHEYKVKSGDTLSEISVQHGVQVSAIKQLNQLSSHSIRVGQVLVLPLTSHVLDLSEFTRYGTKRRYHVVKSGDNLWDISRKYKVKVQDLVRWNKLSNNSLLQPKQKLKVSL
ncbi:LysM peptidoglycan-binding domain-containing protein [Cognaticolwellia mytili]|uniref:LysM peptidoglycan-binding domain-containing protein n=1 Tax=Cognaticolwellia mytili TaxID=1888913 RepID=UPI000A170EF8|nr:LysM peptidoglycan-binding domain-containing protein [Cognaticolwellia mytili]